MSVYFCIPSARPDGGTARHWKFMGYRLALWRDREDIVSSFGPDDIRITAPYPGYSQSVNALMKAAFDADPDCQWCVTGGDDTLPDQGTKPEVIAAQCTQHFNGTFGVMQPTGDAWADRSIERICGSPWVGRDFWRRTYGGNGPMWHEYWHNFNDNELQDVSLHLGVLWQRRDLTHLHQHWMRETNTNGIRVHARPPEFLKRAAGIELFSAMRVIYEQRRAAGFPGAFEPAFELRAESRIEALEAR
jgi:hypothetical protein